MAQLVAQLDNGAVRQGDLVVQVNEYWTMVRALESRLDVPMFDPFEQPGCREDVIDARAVVGLAGLQFHVPA